jgi:hypothetical protein
MAQHQSACVSTSGDLQYPRAAVLERPVLPGRSAPALGATDPVRGLGDAACLPALVISTSRSLLTPGEPCRPDGRPNGGLLQEHG